MKTKTKISLSFAFAVMISLFWGAGNTFAAPSISNCQFPQTTVVNDMKLICYYSGNGEPIFLTKYWATTTNGVGVTQYTVHDPHYDTKNKKGYYFIVGVEDGSGNATIRTIEDNGSTSTELPSQSITVAGTNPESNKDPFATGFRSLLFGEDCPNTSAMSCWLRYVYGWAQTGVLVIATGSLILAGFTYMTSAGDPKRMDFAKRLITGSLSAVLVLVLGRFFLTNVIGIPWL